MPNTVLSLAQIAAAHALLDDQTRNRAQWLLTAPHPDDVDDASVPRREPVGWRIAEASLLLIDTTPQITRSPIGGVFGIKRALLVS